MDHREARPVATLAAALLVAVAALALYRSTLLPGLDFGDTPSFQVMGGAPVITPRDGYPLYFAIGRLFVGALDGDKAHAMNVASAVQGALASALVVLVAAELSGSLLAGMAAAILFVGSYTFWSQSIITEVYALHMLLVALTLLLILRWQQQPTSGRLAIFVAVYALAFGNHLTMILLAPGYLLFLAMTVRGSWRTLINLRTIATTVALTTAGALQYAWNFYALSLRPLPPASLVEAFSAFWFDVTKADWRESMVAQVPTALASERLGMYAFDVRQQFGWLGLLLAAIGLVQMLRTNATRGVLLLALYVTTTAFALTYNVGDSHVFFLPSHLVTALLAAPGLVLIAKLMPWRLAAPGVAVLGMSYGVVRIYSDYPALDRSADHRPSEVLTTLSSNIDDRSALLLTNLNWQVENGLNYFAREIRPELAAVPIQTLLDHAPRLIRDNAAIGRNVIVSERARADLTRAYGDAVISVRDARITTPTMAELVSTVAPGTRYALCVLQSTRDQTIDAADLSAAVRILTGNRLSEVDLTRYTAIAGLAGAPPLLVESHNEPWRRTLEIDGLPVVIRMDAWLAFDTIRRMGFGHVIAGRRHTLIVDRGVSFVAFDHDGAPTVRGYAANIFAPQDRYVVKTNP